MTTLTLSPDASAAAAPALCGLTFHVVGGRVEFGRQAEA
jgi:hypothetical protein